MPVTTLYLPSAEVQQAGELRGVGAAGLRLGELGAQLVVLPLQAGDLAAVAAAPRNTAGDVARELLDRAEEPAAEAVRAPSRRRRGSRS